MNDKKKILFVNDEMVVGGVSKVLNNLFRHFDIDRYELYLLVLHCHGDMLKDVPDYVHVISGTEFFDVCDIPVKECFRTGRFLKKLYFAFLIKSGQIVKRIVKEREKMNLPLFDAEIAFKEGICSVFTVCGNSKKKINWIHADYEVKNYAANYMETMKKLLKRFDAHVAVSNTAADSFKKIFELDRVLTIHNLMKVDEILERSKEPFERESDEFTFVCVGRLHPQKSYNRLLTAMEKLNREGFNYRVEVMGDGPDKEELLSMKNKLGIENVYFLGNQSNPYPRLSKADCLLLTSIYEGLPTVVFEALILGVPVLTTLVAGVDEQLRESGGWIVENSQLGIENGMRMILSQPKLISDMREQLKDYCYDNQKIMKDIEKLIDETVQ